MKRVEPHLIATIGYEGAPMSSVLRALGEAGVSVLVDVRAVANSRRPGFSKRSLAAHLEEVGIAYLHMRDLGTPADGRAAARAGRPLEMHRIFREHLKAPHAQQELEALAQLVQGAQRVCLLCFEARAEICHRQLIVEALAEKLVLSALHLRPEPEDLR
jgi:uncharacterized protein (DUF488 family)